MTRATYVVVGGGLAAGKAVEGLRAAGSEARVVLVGAESVLPYERPELSKGYLRGSTERHTLDVHDHGWYAAHDVEIEIGCAAVLLDAGARTITLDDGRVLGWDRLLLATGAAPRRLVLDGAELDGVHHLRTDADAEALRSGLAHGGHVVIVGGGWLGLEVAAAARHHGALVTVVEPLPTPLYAVLGPELGEVVAQVHRGNGVDVRTGTGVASLAGAAGVVREVVLTDGSRLPADLVVAAIGAAPADALAELAGLAVADGVVVDETLRSVDHPDVFAAGDVARAWHPLYGARLRVEHWANAGNQGMLAGRAMAGEAAAYGKVPYFWAEQFEFSMEYHGWVGPEGYDEVVIRGENDDGEDDESLREFVAFWLRDGRVRAAMNVNVWDQTDALKALVRRQAAVNTSALADTGTDLADLVPESG